MAKKNKGAGKAVKKGTAAQTIQLGVSLFVPLILVLGVIPLIVQMRLVPLASEVQVFWTQVTLLTFSLIINQKPLFWQ